MHKTIYIFFEIFFLKICIFIYFLLFFIIIYIYMGGLPARPLWLGSQPSLSGVGLVAQTNLMLGLSPFIPKMGFGPFNSWTGFSIQMGQKPIFHSGWASAHGLPAQPLCLGLIVHGSSRAQNPAHGEAECMQTREDDEQWMRGFSSVTKCVPVYTVG